MLQVLTPARKIVVTGAAGLLGQNLIFRLSEVPNYELVAIDKHPLNTAILRKAFPNVTVVQENVASSGAWEQHLQGCDTLVIGQAQIGGEDRDEFVKNNVEATQVLLDAARRNNVRYVVAISSSVVNSMAHDLYTETKKAQEQLLDGCEIPHIVLRPTLMFGWFDRKHLGWLARFMQKTPVFPIPGNGRYLRQPLYIGDFCAVVIAAIERKITGRYNITGQERIDYVDLIRAVKAATGSRARIQLIPYNLFWVLLWLYARVSNDPPFTTSQLKALATPDIFEVIDWPSTFQVPSTPLARALDETFKHPVHSKVALAF